MKRPNVLVVDAAINLVLGVLLIPFPQTVARFLGLPAADNAFYPSILGAVLAGIGIALLIERLRDGGELVGLGLGGAIAINLCGGLVLAAWLLGGSLALPPRGRVILWSLVLVLIAISGVELIVQRKNAGSSAAALATESSRRK